MYLFTIDNESNFHKLFMQELDRRMDESTKSWKASNGVICECAQNENAKHLLRVSINENKEHVITIHGTVTECIELLEKSLIALKERLA